MATDGNDNRIQPSSRYESDHKEPHDASCCMFSWLYLQLTNCENRMGVTVLKSSEERGLHERALTYRYQHSHFPFLGAIAMMAFGMCSGLAFQLHVFRKVAFLTVHRRQQANGWRGLGRSDS